MGVKGDVKIQDFEILVRANQFREAAYALKEKGSLYIPLEVNACLACELYLKYLAIFKKNNQQEAKTEDLKKAYGHDLEVLYGKIDNDIKEKIKNEMGSGFEESLSSVKLNFQEIRYDYEYEMITFSPIFLMKFSDVLYSICKE